jgi:Na+-driven multidrug efflux pump
MVVSLTREFQPDPADFQVVLPFVTIYVRIMTLRYSLMGLFFPILGTIRGAGDTMAAMIISAFNQVLIRIPIAILLSKWLGFAAVPAAMSISTVFGLIIVSLYYGSRMWETRGGLVEVGPGVVAQPSDAPD